MKIIDKIVNRFFTVEKASAPQPTQPLGPDSDKIEKIKRTIVFASSFVGKCSFSQVEVEGVDMSDVKMKASAMAFDKQNGHETVSYYIVK